MGTPIRPIIQTKLYTIEKSLSPLQRNLEFNHQPQSLGCREDILVEYLEHGAIITDQYCAE